GQYRLLRLQPTGRSSRSTNSETRYTPPRRSLTDICIYGLRARCIASANRSSSARSIRGHMTQMGEKENNRSMLWVAFAIGAALSWGVYGAMLHNGQVKLGNPLRALLCVGVAYFLIGVLVPVAALWSQGQLSGQGFNLAGTTTATLAGALGAIGAVCIIW